MSTLLNNGFRIGDKISDGHGYYSHGIVCKSPRDDDTAHEVWAMWVRAEDGYRETIPFYCPTTSAELLAPSLSQESILNEYAID